MFLLHQWIIRVPKLVHLLRKRALLCTTLNSLTRRVVLTQTHKREPLKLKTNREGGSCLWVDTEDVTRGNFCGLVFGKCKGISYYQYNFVLLSSWLVNGLNLHASVHSLVYLITRINPVAASFASFSDVLPSSKVLSFLSMQTSFLFWVSCYMLNWELIIWIKLNFDSS